MSEHRSKAGRSRGPTRKTPDARRKSRRGPWPGLAGTLVTGALSVTGLVGCQQEDLGLGDADAAVDGAIGVVNTDLGTETPDTGGRRPDQGPACVPLGGDPAAAELCNQQDDDCDGRTDEGFRLGEGCVVGQGACAADGRIVCAPDGTARCDGVAGSPTGAETCNEVDDDCDGTVDEGFALGAICRVTEGECLNEGREVCNAAGDGVECSALPIEVTEERCDQRDNDCDGVVDEGIDLGALCEAGVGQCRRGGFIECQPDGTVVCNARVAEPRPETCDGFDNDCDGISDEGFGAAACEVGVGACRRQGNETCNAEGVIGCHLQPGAPEPESCNEVDDDCDGEVDEDFGDQLGQACTSGLGVCARPGVFRCQASEGGGGPGGGGPGGGGLGGGYRFEGVAQEVPVAELEAGGFVRCHLDNYGDGQIPIRDIVEACNEDILLMGCGPSGSDTLTLAAMGEREFVLRDVGQEPSTVNEHNGVNWYFNDSWSWGFAAEGSRVERNSCDVGQERSELRMCWHTGGGTMNQGYRCGDNYPFNDFDRVVYHKPAGPGIECSAEPGPAAAVERCNDLDDDCDGLVDEAIPGVGALCVEGVGFCQRGETACQPDGSIACRAIDLEPQPELCNGIDDDCNGDVDDVPGVGEACESGAGVCALSGVLACGEGAGPPLEGVLQNIDEAVLRRQGFEPCFEGAFDGFEPVQDILDACNGALLFLGCGPQGQPGFQLGAMGEREFVLRDLGQERVTVNEHNGVNWYFNDSYSWGFAPAGSAVSRNSCDTEAGRDDERMCWHTGGGQMNFGYRCGNSYPGFEYRRVVWHRLLGAGLVCEAPGEAEAPTVEACNGLDDDCDGRADEDFGLGQACEAGVGACRQPGQILCNANGEVGCSARAGAPGGEVCNGVDDDCDGRLDERLECPFFASCLAAFEAGNRRSGLFPIVDARGAVNNLWCDMETDGGGWTLVASSARTFDDFGVPYYDDLQTLAPRNANAAIFNGLAFEPRSDIRFACRDFRGAAADPMTVDLSFYQTVWYEEFRRAGSDAESCFSEGNGQGADVPVPGRQDNLSGERLAEGTPYQASYLEGEDACGDNGDFTVDFNDRGMDNNETDGTDWGEDDGSQKCGRSYPEDGQWFIFVRERAPR